MTTDPRHQETYVGDDRSILTYVTQTRIVKTSAGGSLWEEEEVLVGDTTKKVSPSTTVNESANDMCHRANSVIVSNFALDTPVFSPMYILPYVDMLCYLGSHPHMLYTQYASYVNVSRLRLIVDVNECHSVVWTWSLL